MVAKVAPFLKLVLVGPQDLGLEVVVTAMRGGFFCTVEHGLGTAEDSQFNLQLVADWLKRVGMKISTPRQAESVSFGLATTDYMDTARVIIAKFGGFETLSIKSVFFLRRGDPSGIHQSVQFRPDSEARSYIADLCTVTPNEDLEPGAPSSELLPLDSTATLEKLAALGVLEDFREETFFEIWLKLHDSTTTQQAQALAMAAACLTPK